MGRKNQSYFLIFALIGLIAVLMGFGYTYIVPLSKGSFNVPIAVHIHGAFSLSWILLYLFQNLLIRRNNLKLHMSMGICSLIVLLGFFLSLFPTMDFGIQRDLAEIGDRIYGLNIVSLISGIWVLCLGLAGLYYRKSPEIHKRLMFLATVVILWPAWGRWRHYFPNIQNADILFQLYIPYSFIILAWIYEKVKFGKIHRTLLIFGSLIIIDGFIASYYTEWKCSTELMKWIFN